MPGESLAEIMAAFGQQAVEGAREHLGVELDFSVESVRTVEDWLQTQHSVLAQAEDLDGISKREVRQSLAMMWGGYLGEVVRRRWGGEWVVLDEGPFEGKVCLIVTTRAQEGAERQLTLFPPERAFKQLCNGAEDGVWPWIGMVSARIAGTDPEAAFPAR